MSGFIDKIYKISQTASNFATVSKVLGSGGGSNLLGGLNLGSIDINNLGSIGGNIESIISSKSSELMSGLDGAINVGDIENIAADLTPEDVGIDLNSIKTDIPGLDLSSLGLNGLNFF